MNISSIYRGLGMKKARFAIIAVIMAVCTALCLTVLLLSLKKLDTGDYRDLDPDSEYRRAKKQTEKLFGKLSFPDDEDSVFYFNLTRLDTADFYDNEVFSVLSDVSSIKILKSALEQSTEFELSFFDYTDIKPRSLDKTILEKILKYEGCFFNADELSLLWADIFDIKPSTPVDLSCHKNLSFFSETSSEKLEELCKVNSAPYMSLEDAAAFLRIDKGILAPLYENPKEPTEPILRMTLPELASYLRSDIIDNPEYSELINDELREDLLRFIKFADKDLFDKNLDADDLSELLETDKSTISAVLLLKNPFGSKKSKLPDFVDFVIENVAENPMLSSYIDDRTMYQLRLLRTIIDYTRSGKALNYTETAELFEIDKELTKMLYERKEGYSDNDAENTITRNVITMLHDIVLSPDKYAFSAEKTTELSLLSDAFSLIGKNILSPKEFIRLISTDLAIADEQTVYRVLLLDEDAPESISVEDFLNKNNNAIWENEMYNVVSDYLNTVLLRFTDDTYARQFIAVKSGASKKDADRLLKEIKQCANDVNLDIKLCSRSQMRHDLNIRYTFIIRLSGILMLIFLSASVFSLFKALTLMKSGQTK